MPKDPKNDRRGEYGSRRWRCIRAQHLQLHPLCVQCEREGLVVAAEVVHHIEPHEGDRTKFFLGKLESLCRMHHEQHHDRGRKQWELDEDGWVIDAPKSRDMRKLLTRAKKKRDTDKGQFAPDPVSLIG